MGQSRNVRSGVVDINLLPSLFRDARCVLRKRSMHLATVPDFEPWAAARTSLDASPKNIIIIVVHRIDVKTSAWTKKRLWLKGQRLTVLLALSFYLDCDRMNGKRNSRDAAACSPPRPPPPSSPFFRRKRSPAFRVLGGSGDLLSSYFIEL